MTPITFERAVHYFQETAQQLSKATVKLDDALRVVSDVLAESLDFELGITCPADEHPPWPVHSVGLFRFNYEDAIGRQRSDLALGVCDKDLKPSPLVQLSGQNAPRTASRNLRVWAGKNIAQIIQLIAETNVVDLEKAKEASAFAETAARLTPGVDLKTLGLLSLKDKRPRGYGFRSDLKGLPTMESLDDLIEATRDWLEDMSLHTVGKDGKLIPEEGDELDQNGEIVLHEISEEAEYFRQAFNALTAARHELVEGIKESAEMVAADMESEKYFGPSSKDEDEDGED